MEPPVALVKQNSSCPKRGDLGGVARNSRVGFKIKFCGDLIPACLHSSTAKTRPSSRQLFCKQNQVIVTRKSSDSSRNLTTDEAGWSSICVLNARRNPKKLWQNLGAFLHRSCPLNVPFSLFEFSKIPLPPHNVNLLIFKNRRKIHCEWGRGKLAKAHIQRA